MRANELRRNAMCPPVNAAWPTAGAIAGRCREPCPRRQQVLMAYTHNRRCRRALLIPASAAMAECTKPNGRAARWHRVRCHQALHCPSSICLRCSDCHSNEPLSIKVVISVTRHAPRPRAAAYPTVGLRSGVPAGRAMHCRKNGLAAKSSVRPSPPRHMRS